MHITTHIHTHSIGQLRWNQTAASQPGTSNSNSNSSNSNQQQQQQQPQPSGSSSPQVSDLFPGLTQEQVDRDVQQLARDVFKKGQQLAGGRCVRVGWWIEQLVGGWVDG